MKNLIILTAIFLVIACSEDDNNTPSQPIDDPFDPGAMNVDLLKEGTLAGVGHSVGGTVRIYDDNGKKTVLLDPFTSQNGPDLKVYLATDDRATRYMNLGALKSTMGKQSYAIEGAPDLDEYTFVLIWCQEFSVLFGRAELR